MGKVLFEPSNSCPLAKPRPREEFLLRITTTSCIFLPLFSHPSTLPNMWATLSSSSSSLPYPYAAGGEDRRVPLLLFLPNPKFGPSCFLFLSPPSLYPHTTPPSSHFPLIWFRTLARFFPLPPRIEEGGNPRMLREAAEKINSSNLHVGACPVWVQRSWQRLGLASIHMCGGEAESCECVSSPIIKDGWMPLMRRLGSRRRAGHINREERLKRNSCPRAKNA